MFLETSCKTSKRVPPLVLALPHCTASASAERTAKLRGSDQHAADCLSVFPEYAWCLLY